MDSPTPTGPEQCAPKAPSHSCVVAPHTWLLNTSVSVHSSASCSTHAVGKSIYTPSASPKPPLIQGQGTGKPRNSYSISPRFPAEDAIAHM